MSLASSDQPGMLGSFKETVVFSTNVPMGRVRANAVRMPPADPAREVQQPQQLRTPMKLLMKAPAGQRSMRASIRAPITAKSLT
jgi:hypothetical protein